MPGKVRPLCFRRNCDGVKDSKADFLPAHLILGVGDYAKIKTTTAPRFEFLDEPIVRKEDQARLDYNFSSKRS